MIGVKILNFLEPLGPIVPLFNIWLIIYVVMGILKVVGLA